MDSYGTRNSQLKDRKKRYACELASRRVSVLTLCFIMKIHETVRGMMDGDYTFIVYTPSSMNPETGD